MYSLTWIVDFRETRNIKEVVRFFTSPVFKYTPVSELSGLIDFESVESIKAYFDEQKYKPLLNRYWGGEESFATGKFNLIVLADSAEIYFASLFTYFLKKSNDFLLNIGLSANYYIKTYLISFWEHAWNNTEVESKTSALLELTLFQNAGSLARPFDLVFVYKNTNEGILNYGKYWQGDDVAFHQSRSLQLISYLSSVGTDTMLNEDNVIWSRSCGGLLIYYDIENVYEIKSKRIADVLLSSFIESDHIKWSLSEKSKISDSLKLLSVSNLFTSLSANHNNQATATHLDTRDAWNWFSLKKLSSFFETILSSIVFFAKSARINFQKAEYSRYRKKIDENFKKLLSGTQIPDPEVIFDKIFSDQLFSLKAYEKAVKEMIDAVIALKSDHMDRYRAGYGFGQGSFIAFPMDDTVKKEYEFIESSFRNVDDLKLNEEEQNYFAKLKYEAERVPHPAALLFKTFALSTVVVMLAFIPLTTLLGAGSLNLALTYLILLFLFALPFYFSWNHYGASFRRIKAINNEFTALYLYTHSRRITSHLFNRLDGFYDDYLIKCNQLLDHIEAKKKFLKILPTVDVVATNQFSAYAVRSATDVLDKMPNLNIDLFGNDKLNTADIGRSEDINYELFDNLIQNTDLTLQKLLDQGAPLLQQEIKKLLKNSNGNFLSVADLLFNGRDNIRPIVKKELLDAVPSFSSIKEQETLRYEILYHATESSAVKENMSLFFQPLTHQIQYRATPDYFTHQLNILAITYPHFNLLTLFKLNLRESFYDSLMEYYKSNRSRLNTILTLVYNDIIQNIKAMLELKLTDPQMVPKSYQACFNGFDQKFEEEKFLNKRAPLFDEFMSYNTDIIEGKIGDLLTKQ